MREQVNVYELFSETVTQLGRDGLLLVGGERGNPMTIGWGTIGRIWAKPVFIVLVRSSRFTFSLLEGLGEFSVNVPSASMSKEVAFCGSRSGRDTDKIAECGFTLEKGKLVAVPYIKECSIHYECKTIHTNDVVNASLDPGIISQFYKTGDFHRIYYGEILGVFREK